MKKYFKFLILVILVLPIKTYALSSVLYSPKSTYNPSEEFYVDVLLDPTGYSVNALEGTIDIQKDLKVIRIEDGDSIVKSWILKPEPKNSINFSGIMPNGFDGYINTPNDKKGLVFRVVLSAQDIGSYNFSVNNLKIARNDGLGTIVPVDNKSIKIGIIGQKSNERYLANDTEGPQINYQIVSDPNLFEGKLAIAFSIQDNKSGVKNVFVKEGSLDWKPAQNPYLLEDQSRKSIIIIKAIDNNNNETIEKIMPLISAYFSTIFAKVVLIIIMSALLVGIYYARKKIKNNKKAI